LLIVVIPVNDAPALLQLESSPLSFSIGSEPIELTERGEVIDVDDQNLVVVEIGFDSATYQAGYDVLLFDRSENIFGFFDATVGTLSFIGEASLTEYQQIIRSVRYDFSNANDSVPIKNNKAFYIKLNDGKSVSGNYARAISIIDNVQVNIPGAFTPNDDNANDTWIIEPLKESANIRGTFIRVYTRSGNLVYKSESFEEAWDGRFNGDLLPADSYFYVIEVDLSYTKKNFKGIVTILR
jgi:gliding motility-associated-like protein